MNKVTLDEESYKLSLKYGEIFLEPKLLLELFNCKFYFYSQNLLKKLFFFFANKYFLIINMVII
jgi:hypothetical protein